MSNVFTLASRYARPVARIGNLPVESLGLEETAAAFVDYCLSEPRKTAPRPLYSTSVNGQVISMCARNPKLARLFRIADTISADGQPMVTVSRLLARNPLPERVATTDLFPEVARLANQAGLSFYFLGSTERVNRKAVEATRRAYPNLRIAGARNGYFPRDEEDVVIADIVAAKPDILWVSLGVPLEQQFVVRNLDRLKGVGVVKTAGGLFDFLSLEKRRAPKWMQNCGLEWLFRTLIEPRRLFLRYATTNPHAMFVLLTSMR